MALTLSKKWEAGARDEPFGFEEKPSAGCYIEPLGRRVGCTSRLRNNAAGLCRPAAFVGSYGTSTISFFIGPKTASNSPFSCSGTLNVSSAWTRSSTSALNAAVVIFMPLCVVFISLPS
jgi:hypothetical protein